MTSFQYSAFGVIRETESLIEDFHDVFCSVSSSSISNNEIYSNNNSSRSNDNSTAAAAAADPTG